MILPRLSLFIVPLIISGCFLIDKIEGEDDPDVFDPGTSPISQAFSVPPTNEIKLMSIEGVGLTIPADGLQTKLGTSPAGAAMITLTCHIFDLSHPWNMPGGFLAQNAAGLPGALTSFGAVEIIMTDKDGNDLDLKPGVTAELAIPALAGGPETIPLWYFDEIEQLWFEDGIAIKIEAAYVGTVTHFTKWNADIFANRACIKGAIVDGDGFAVSGTIVTAHLTKSKGLSGGQVYTDAEGGYQIEGLSGGETYAIKAFGYDASDSLEITLPVEGSACIPVDVMVLEYGALGAEGVSIPVDSESDSTGNTTSFAGSCDSIASQGLCVDYTGSSFTSQGVASSCASYNPPATYSSLPCSRTNAHGVCTQYPGDVTEIQSVFDATYYPLQDATTGCSTMNGVWSPL